MPRGNGLRGHIEVLKLVLPLVGSACSRRNMAVPVFVVMAFDGVI